MDRFVDRAVTLVDKDGVPFSSTNPIPTGIIVEDIQIGAVELKNATTDDRAKIALLSALAASDLGLGVTDPVTKAALLGILGAIDGAAVVSDANGTQQQYLRGLVKLLSSISFKAASTLPLATDTAQVVTLRDQATVGGTTPRLTASFSNPASGGAYSAGDIIANSATAGSVVPITFTPGRNSGRITGCRCVVTPASGNLVTTALDFELLLFRSNTNIPFAAGGYPADNGALAVTAAAYREMIGTFKFLASGWRSPAGSASVAGVTGYQAVVSPSGRPIEPFNIAGLAGTIIGIVQALNSWTPGAVINQFDFALDADLD